MILHCKKHQARCYLQIFLFHELLQLFLKNILFDMSNFSSFLKFCSCLGATSRSNLLETA